MYGFLQVRAAVHAVCEGGSAAAEPVFQGRLGQRAGHWHRADRSGADHDVHHGRHPHAHSPQAAPEKVRGHAYYHNVLSLL